VEDKCTESGRREDFGTDAARARWRVDGLCMGSVLVLVGCAGGGKMCAKECGNNGKGEKSRKAVRAHPAEVVRAQRCGSLHGFPPPLCLVAGGLPAFLSLMYSLVSAGVLTQ